jgi:hypothetical protein
MERKTHIGIKNVVVQNVKIFLNCGGENIEKGKYMNKFLLYITNNEKESRYEEIFDMVFFIITTLSLVIGIVVLCCMGEPQWIAFLIIEYVWALDNIRHNRP